MAFVLRIAPALCAALALLLVPEMARADDPRSMNSFGPPLYEHPAAHEPGDLALGLVPATSQFEVSAAVLFLQPSSGNLVYATRVNPFPFLSPNWGDEVVRPGFTPAFNVGARFSLGCGGDLQASWTHLSTFDHASAQGDATPVVVDGATTGVKQITLPGSSTPISVVVPTTTTYPKQALSPQFLVGPPPPYSSANSQAHFAYDAVNMDAGVWLGCGPHVQLRLLAGLQAANIRQTLSTRFANGDSSIVFVDDSQASFIGAGPRMGMDLHYVAGRFDFLGGIGGTTLVGTRQNRLNFFTVSPSNTANGLIPNTQYFTTPTTTQLIPGIDLRLGGSYSLPVGKSGTLTCAAGYQTAVYFNVINQFTLTEVENTAVTLTEGTASVYVRSAVESQSNFFVHGPFFKVGLQF